MLQVLGCYIKMCQTVHQLHGLEIKFQLWLQRRLSSGVFQCSMEIIRSDSNKSLIPEVVKKGLIKGKEMEINFVAHQSGPFIEEKWSHQQSSTQLVFFFNVDF